MSLISLVVALVILGVILYLLQLIPMDETIRKIVYVVIILAVILFLVKILLGGAIPDIRIG